MVLMPASFMLSPHMNIDTSRADISFIEETFTHEYPTLTPELQKQADIIIEKSKSVGELMSDKTLTLEEKKLYRTDIDALRLVYKSFANTENGTLLATRSHIDSLANTTDYVPWWIITLVSIAIGSGTMVGWKRIVKTIGEKI